MNTTQTAIAAPFRLLGWLCATAAKGWTLGVAASNGKPTPTRLVRILHPSKLEAIRALRNAIPGMGLKEAKDACNWIESGRPLILPDTLANPDALKGIFEFR